MHPCTDNRTITNGSYFVKSDTVGDADWYQAFKNSRQQVMLYSFYEDGKESGGYIGKGRHLVWMRKIEGNTNDFVMMDFNYDKLLKKIQMESGSADCDPIGRLPCIIILDDICSLQACICTIII